MPDIIEQVNWSDGTIEFYEWYNMPGKTAREYIERSPVDSTVALWIIKPKPHVATN